jgi:hypothetical protein
MHELTNFYFLGAGCIRSGNNGFSNEKFRPAEPIFLSILVQPDKNTSDPMIVPPSSSATDDNASLLFMILKLKSKK